MRLFITGTGTEIGKTFVAASLTHQLRRAGETVHALKPVVSGLAHTALYDSDPGVLLRAAGRPVRMDEVAAVSPWRFADPISPDMAARREGRRIDLEPLIAFCREERPGHTLVEGVGGAMVPLSPYLTVMDWMHVLQWPALLVAGSYLGTLSHTLTAYEACVARGVTVAGVVVSQSPEQPVPLAETIDSLRAQVGCPVLGVPRVSGPRPWERAADLLPLLRDTVAARG